MHYSILGSIVSLVPSIHAVWCAPAVSLPDGLDEGKVVGLLNGDLITHLDVLFAVDTVITNLLSANFDVQNLLPLEITIDHVTADAGINGTALIHFDQAFTGFIVPGLGTANSGTFDNVSLTQGVLALLPIVPLGELDILNADVSLRVATINGSLGVPLAMDGLQESDVNTTPDIDSLTFDNSEHL
ncbi:hypothetical protein EWM64_g1587 [Hericium alpestre]|uniref:Uncharacterized protein n=1 Tax=Hericium alpestre TaxID=135208 RepID=A0A4Z0AA77_9AGAM|nr:hypothetical protein EWM64_g1587 [Hericium alpestre]